MLFELLAAEATEVMEQQKVCPGAYLRETAAKDSLVI